MLRPSRFFIWLQAMMTLAADVNPDTTGNDMNSIRNPKRRTPNNIVMHPDKKQSKAAYSGIPLKRNRRAWNARALLRYAALSRTMFFVKAAYEKLASNNSVVLQVERSCSISMLFHSRDRMKLQAGTLSIMRVNGVFNTSKISLIKCSFRSMILEFVRLSLTGATKFTFCIKRKYSER